MSKLKKIFITVIQSIPQYLKSKVAREANNCAMIVVGKEVDGGGGGGGDGGRIRNINFETGGSVFWGGYGGE